MEALRQLKQVQLLASWRPTLAGALPLMKVERPPHPAGGATIAEVVRQSGVAQMSERTVPRVAVSGQRGFAAVSCSKLGHGTRLRLDLDLRCSCTATNSYTRWLRSPSTAASSTCAWPSGSASVQHPALRPASPDRHAAAPPGEAPACWSHRCRPAEQYQQQEARTWGIGSWVRAR